MIKKASEVQPGDMINGKQVIIIERDRVHSGNEIIWLWFTHERKSATILSPEAKIWVDEVSND